MEGIKICGSLAEFFAKTKNAKQTYRKLNPESSNIANYMIKTSQIREGVKCSADNKCQWFNASNDERNKSDLQTYVLCIACDRLFHVRCTEFNFSGITEEQLPWMCHVCQSIPMNSAAQSVVFDDKHLMSFKDRILEFSKSKQSVVTGTVPKKAAEKPQAVQKEFENSIYEVADDTHSDVDTISHTELLRKFKELQARYTSIANENENLQRTIYENPVPQPIFSSTGLNPSASSTNLPTSRPQVPLSVPKPSNRPISYTNAIIDANYAATRVDEELGRSREMGQVFFNDIGQNIRTDPGLTDHLRPSNFAGNSVGNESNSNNITDCLTGISNQVTLLSLGEIRKSLPKIELFDGNPEKWLAFQRAVERTWQEGRYDEAMMRRIIRKALTGQALERVDGILDLVKPEQTMKYLKDSYGNANIVVEAAKSKLLNAKLSRPLTHASCVEVTTYIASYMAACSYAGLVITDTYLASRIHNQLESYHQEAYYKYFYDKFPNATTRMERLDVQFDFLNYIAKTLPLGSFLKPDNKDNKSKGFQVMSVSSSPSTQSSKPYSYNSDGYKFEIRDKETAKFIGYDLEKVRLIPKKCEICYNEDHYTVECSSYRAMKLDERYDKAREKGLCTNCLITTSHSAKDCEVKHCCGYKFDTNIRCTGKHHVTLHRNSYNHPSFNKNYKNHQQRAYFNNSSARLDDQTAQQSQNDNDNNNQPAVPIVAPITVQQPAAQAPVVQGYHVATPIAFTLNYPDITGDEINRPYVVTTVASHSHPIDEGSQRTVKLFRTIFHSQMKIATGFSIGDSASEITLVKRELIDDLGIVGEPCIINLQWTDSIVKSTEALKVKLEISGILANSERLILDECYAINNLMLPPRSLNVDRLKSKFPHLREVPFESYKNAIPTLLIGSRHAHMIEATTPVIQDGSNKPVAIKSKLGFTIFGGAPECFDVPFTVNNHQLESNSNENYVRPASERDIPAQRSNSHAFVPLVPRKSVLNTHLLPRAQSAFKEFKSFCNYCRVHPIEFKMLTIPNICVKALKSFKATDSSGPFQEITKKTNASLAIKPVQAFQQSSDGNKVSHNSNNYRRKAWERDRIFKSYYAKDGNGQVTDIILPNGSIRKKKRSTKSLAKLGVRPMTI